MQRLEVSGAVRPIYVSLGVKRLKKLKQQRRKFRPNRKIYAALILPTVTI